ncbi:MAG: nucleotide exchange factor GrpE [Candidatus Alkaliphilus sp. MAG34]|nr:nucleotide exchange factor GrpE [Clostridiales bacterium]
MEEARKETGNEEYEEVRISEKGIETSEKGEITTDNGIETTTNETEKNGESVDSNLETVTDKTEESEEKSVTLEEELTEKTAQYEEIFNRFQRLQADFANYKKRVEKEKSEIFLYANEKIGLDLLNIIDSLEMAIHPQNKPDNSNEFDCLLDGINLVYKQLIDVLARHGIEEIEALGKPFDMNFHHAVVQEEAEGEPNHVIGVLQKGYKINERVLRPAMVKVSK